MLPREEGVDADFGEEVSPMTSNVRGGEDSFISVTVLSPPLPLSMLLSPSASPIPPPPPSLNIRFEGGRETDRDETPWPPPEEECDSENDNDGDDEDAPPWLLRPCHPIRIGEDAVMREEEDDCGLGLSVGLPVAAT
uniref:Uncharacterized protein n=1 Tax=Pseudictyota dubia TaxID=2749911 RepID=A0A7R9ZEN7_9STRA